MLRDDIVRFVPPKGTEAMVLWTDDSTPAAHFGC